MKEKKDFMYKLVLLRHGESIWNKRGLFTGWTDVDLSAQGVKEAQAAGKELKKNKFIFDFAYTSFLKRAARTLRIVLTELKEERIPTVADWRLNERHYGNLQGLSKQETAAKFGESQVLIWRRSYSVRPPKITKDNKYNQKHDPLYQGITVPDCESLRDVVIRVVPLWRKEIAPRIKQGKKIIVSASGNSLRALVKYLDKVSPAEIAKLDIPTGIPLIYEFDKNLKPLRHYYLADARKLKIAVDKVKKQGKKK